MQFCCVHCRVMLSVVLCLGVMVEDQSRQLISRMRHQHRTKAMTSQLVDSKCKVHVNLKCNSLLSVHRIRGTSHCVRDSMRHSDSVNWQMVRNISVWIKPTNNLSLFLIWFLWGVSKTQTSKTQTPDPRPRKHRPRKHRPRKHRPRKPRPRKRTPRKHRPRKRRLRKHRPTKNH